MFVCGYLGDCIGLDDSDKLEKDYQIVTPTKIQALDGYHIVQVSACYQHAVAVSRDGAVFSWGKVFELTLKLSIGVGSWYRLGHGDEKFVQFPKRIQQLSGYKAVLVSAGMTTTFIHTGMYISFLINEVVKHVEDCLLLVIVACLGPLNRHEQQ